MRRVWLRAFFWIKLKPRGKKQKKRFFSLMMRRLTELLPHRNLQQNKERRPSSALKQASQDLAPRISWRSELLPRQTRRLPRLCVGALSVSIQAEGIPCCCLCFHENIPQDQPQLVMAGWWRAIREYVCYCLQRCGFPWQQYTDLKTSMASPSRELSTRPPSGSCLRDASAWHETAIHT